MKSKKVLLKDNPFLKVNPFTNVNIMFHFQTDNDIYTQFKEMIQNKDKLYLQSVQILLQERLKELL